MERSLRGGGRVKKNKIKQSREKRVKDVNAIKERTCWFTDVSPRNNFHPIKDEFHTLSSATGALPVCITPFLPLSFSLLQQEVAHPTHLRLLRHTSLSFLSFFVWENKQKNTRMFFCNEKKKEKRTSLLPSADEGAKGRQQAATGGRCPPPEWEHPSPPQPYLKATIGISLSSVLPKLKANTPKQQTGLCCVWVCYLRLTVCTSVTQQPCVHLSPWSPSPTQPTPPQPHSEEERREAADISPFFFPLKGNISTFWQSCWLH